jgi:hypothetical protein
MSMLAGTVFEREMMATRMRLDAAQNSVHKHKLRSLGVGDDDVKVRYQSCSALMAIECNSYLSTTWRIKADFGYDLD